MRLKFSPLPSTFYVTTMCGFNFIRLSLCSELTFTRQSCLSSVLEEFQMSFQELLLCDALNPPFWNTYQAQILGSPYLVCPLDSSSLLVPALSLWLAVLVEFFLTAFHFMNPLFYCFFLDIIHYIDMFVLISVTTVFNSQASERLFSLVTD